VQVQEALLAVIPVLAPTLAEAEADRGHLQEVDEFVLEVEAHHPIQVAVQ